MKRIVIFFQWIFFSFLIVQFIDYAYANNNKPTFTKLDKIIAIVNNEVITQSELTKEMEKVEKQLEHTHQALPSKAELRKQVLDSLIAKSLQLQLCKVNNILVNDEEVNNVIANIARTNKVTVAQLKDAIEQTGFTMKEYTAQIHDQLLMQKIQQEQVARNISFTPDDIKKFMRENKDKFTQFSTYHVLDVLIPAKKNVSLDETKKQISAVFQQLKTSHDLDNLLKQYPDMEENDMGWRPLAEFPTIFQQKIAEMKVNSVSTPIQAPNGFHILKLIEAKGQNAPLDEKTIKALAFQHKAQESVKDWVLKLRKEAYIKILN